ncbi:MAG: hypothetical protein JWP99_505 [Devosia sp.]|nr:hypothetical protein [Devosia sp.]
MLIENMMYFALGALVAGLLALIILPAVWKRAVRLTKRRIEAATPITMAEFRADKDQLRAEFALSTRRLEMTVETLRKRLAEQLSDFNQNRSELGVLKAERGKHEAIIAELEARGVELSARVQELEREAADLAQRLRRRDREFDAREAELVKLREALSARENASSENAGSEDPEGEDPSSEDPQGEDPRDMVAAEARLVSAERRLNALLAETGQVVDISAGRGGQLLADKLSREAELDALRGKVGTIEGSILADWGTERLQEAPLRQKLNDIAASVSRLVYAVESDSTAGGSQEVSLFDRVQRFADGAQSVTDAPLQPSPSDRSGSVSDRMAALREIQGR